MESIEISECLTPTDEDRILRIWNNVYPVQVIFREAPEFHAYLDKAADAKHFIKRDDHLSVIAWLMTFNRDEKRYFVMLVSDDMQQRGIGKELVMAMKKAENNVSGWVVDSDHYQKADGKTYLSPMIFYKKLGFEITDKSMTRDDFVVRMITWGRAIKK